MSCSGRFSPATWRLSRFSWRKTQPESAGPQRTITIPLFTSQPPMARSRWVFLFLLKFEILSDRILIGFQFCLVVLFQILSMLLDRSVSPDLLNRHKQVSLLERSIGCQKVEGEFQYFPSIYINLELQTECDIWVTDKCLIYGFAVLLSSNLC